eukprot:CAMPEP_0180645412 /NCGR_PEP_ID=MMETSP1037_2-20121125/48974_1 /TAXON_ID=632150 /ORGANISM="Azadinium spinosum, Strain 3D9" /LENGTH=75 /DNA_ID=CAMNT_0022669265 /DNA_START=27 /DNA_END=251 /DNA_ORIENTATION=-
MDHHVGFPKPPSVRAKPKLGPDEDRNDHHRLKGDEQRPVLPNQILHLVRAQRRRVARPWKREAKQHVAIKAVGRV